MMAARCIVAAVFSVLLFHTSQVHGYCYAIAANAQKDSFHYVAKITSLGQCNAQQVNISRLYMQGSCLNKRNNDFSTYPDCSKDGGAVMGASLQSCEQVFASNAPKGTFRLLSDVGGAGNIFDEADVCNTGNEGFFFVNTSCSTWKNDAQLLFSLQPNNYCSTRNSVWGGISHGIKVAISIVVICLIAVCFFGVFCLMRRRRMAAYGNNQGPPVVGMQPYPHQGPPQQPHYGAQPGQYQGYGGQPYSGQPQGYTAQGQYNQYGPQGGPSAAPGSYGYNQGSYPGYQPGKANGGPAI